MNLFLEVNAEEQIINRCFHNQINEISKPSFFLEKENQGIPEYIQYMPELNEYSLVLDSLVFYCQLLGNDVPSLKKYWTSREKSMQISYTGDSSEITKLTLKTITDVLPWFKKNAKFEFANTINVQIIEPSDITKRNIIYSSSYTMDVNHLLEKMCKRKIHTGKVVGSTIFICLAKDNFKDYYLHLKLTLLHELFHIYQVERSSLITIGHIEKNKEIVEINGPSWLIEGSATIFSYLYDSQANIKDMNSIYSNFVTENYLDDQHLSIDELNYFSGSSIGVTKLYRISDYLVTELIKDKGFDAVFEYFTLKGEDVPWQDAFETAFDISYKNFISQFNFISTGNR